MVAQLRAVEAGLQALAEAERLSRLVELRQGLEGPDLRVVVFGEFNRGKSTLINALLGQLVLSSKLIPTTGQITRVVAGRTEGVRVHFLDGRLETTTLDRLDSLATLDRDGRAREDIDFIEVAVPSLLLGRGLMLVDTPGVNEGQAQTRRARRAIALADLVLLLLDARQLLGALERELAVDWLSQELEKPVVPVLNFLNFVEAGEQQELRLRLDSWARRHLRTELGRPWYEVNARGAALHSIKGAAPPADHFLDLRNALEGLDETQRLEFRRRSRYGALRALVRELRRHNDAILGRLQEDHERLEQERAALYHDLKDRGRRLDADAQVRRQRLLTFAEADLKKRFDLLVKFDLRGASKASLESKASRWYESRLAAGVAAIEKEGQAALLELAGDHLPRPDLLTIRENLILTARFSIGELEPAEPDNGASQLGAAVVGGILGSLLLPGVGTGAGLWLGARAARYLGLKEPDYPAAYTERAREAWTPTAVTILRTLGQQFDARVAELKRVLGERLQAAAPASQASAIELHQRRQLADALEGCAGALESA